MPIGLSIRLVACGSGTGPMLQKADRGREMNRENALARAAEMSEASHLGYDDWRRPDAGRPVHVAFGRGTGTCNGVSITDVHGAGCQRSDPKGDVSRVCDYMRLVRDAD